MTIFAVVNTKGGVGKSTAAVHLAARLACDGPTLLIDGDTQPSAASWAAWRRDSSTTAPSPTTTRLSGKAILTEGKRLAEGFAHVVVDAGGRDAIGLRSALLLANVAIVPIGASSFDSAAMTDLLEVVELAHDFNPGLQVRVLLNRIDGRTKDADEMRAYLAEQKLTVMDAQIGERVAFRRSIKEGVTVHELGKDAAAMAEMDAFFTEVMQ
jgi:chromosome partitioning protein